MTGIVMGDGAVVVPDKNPSLHVKMVNDEFLDWLDEELGWLSNGYTKVQTAEEAAQENRETGFSENASAENYQDKYTLRTKADEQLWQWRDWYSSGEKVYPDGLDLTPTTLKMWYVCDGCKENYNSEPHISITCLNEVERTKKLLSLFSDLPVEPVPHKSQKSFSLRFNQTDSIWLWGYMGDAPRGFEHKFP